MTTKPGAVHVGDRRIPPIEPRWSEFDLLFLVQLVFPPNVRGRATLGNLHRVPLIGEASVSVPHLTGSSGFSVDPRPTGMLATCTNYPPQSPGALP